MSKIKYRGSRREVGCPMCRFQLFKPAAPSAETRETASLGPPGETAREASTLTRRLARSRHHTVATDLRQLAHEPVPVLTKVAAQLADPRRGYPEHAGDAAVSAATGLDRELCRAEFERLLTEQDSLLIGRLALGRLLTFVVVRQKGLKMAACPHCGKALKVPAEAIGKVGRCPACNNNFKVAASVQPKVASFTNVATALPGPATTNPAPVSSAPVLPPPLRVSTASNERTSEADSIRVLEKYR
jgi:hypothetical protein